MKTFCSICNKPCVGRGYCKKHYRAFMKHGDPLQMGNLRGVPFDQRYQTDEKGCWLWIGGTNQDGYGAFARYGEKRAHRVSWVMHRGPIPAGMHVLHTCDVPGCVNPDHLFLGTHQDNMADLRSKGRAYGAKGEANFGAKVTEDQALTIMRDSRTCEQIAQEYDLTATSVDNIRNGKTWSYLFDEQTRKARIAAGPRRYLTPTEEDAIFIDKRKQMDLAHAYGVSQSKVSTIKRRSDSK